MTKGAFKGMGVVISAILVIYFSKNVLDYFSFYKKLDYFILEEEDQLIPNLSFNLDVIRSGLKIVRSVLLLKINLFIFSVWTFLLYILSNEWAVNEMVGVTVQYILGTIIVINLWIVINVKYFHTSPLYKGEKVNFHGWNRLGMRVTKEELQFYLLKNELILTGHFEVTDNEHKNDYWKRLAKEDKE